MKEPGPTQSEDTACINKDYVEPKRNKTRQDTHQTYTGTL